MKIEFSSANGQELAGTLDLPSGPPLAYALWAHCFSCGKDLLAASRIAKGLRSKGFAVLRFDFTGLGASEGDFANTNFTSNVEDLVAAANHLRNHFQAPQLLIGHSWGGTAMLAAAAQVPEAKAVCTIAAPADPEHVAKLFRSSLAEIEAEGVAEVLLGDRSFRIKKQFLDDIADWALRQKIATLKKALLVFHSPTDAVVGIENASLIFKAAKHPKSFVSLDRADHLLSGEGDAAYVASLIAPWAARYIAPEAPAAIANADDETVVVSETGAGRFATAISIGGRHQLLADEPLAYGGTDTGPTPYELLLAALGACKTMTMRMYADKKGLPLDRATVTLRHSKVHEVDCEDCESEGAKLDRIDVEVDIRGDLEADARKRIAAIAEKCPVHRTLTSDVLIDSHDPSDKG